MSDVSEQRGAAGADGSARPNASRPPGARGDVDGPGRAREPAAGAGDALADDPAQPGYLGDIGNLRDIGDIGDAGTLGDTSDAGHTGVSGASPEGAEFLPSDSEVLTRERDDYLAALQRLQADFDNYRKRVRQDIELEVGRGTEKLMNRLLPVLDTFELALAHEPEPDASPLAKLHDQLLTALEAEGLERLSPHGLPFDPAESEAVLHEPADSAGEPTAGTAGPVVSEVLRAGYRWKGRVVRAAMVKVKG